MTQRGATVDAVGPVVTVDAAAATRAASTQSWLTIRWLADRDRRADAFALYAWFRWVDDLVDEHLPDAASRLALVARQRRVLDGAAPEAPEERLAAWLAGRGVRPALDAMLDVMAFDAGRRGRLVAQAELDACTHDLAVAVTESIHHCIGHGRSRPGDPDRYAAVTGAHVAHMLRDMAEDLAVGCCNVPAELLDGRVPAFADLGEPHLRAWVRDRVRYARSCFATGRRYLARVESARCRLAGHAYVARFEWVLDRIERDGYRLRPAYPERATVRGGLAIAADAARSCVRGEGS
jgi:phytoene/squalene synthetase